MRRRPRSRSVGIHLWMCCTIITKVWKTGDWPEDWTRSMFVPLHKKGDSRVCSNYRTISLVSHASKVLLQIILERIRAKVETELSDEQAGFRPGRGTRNHLVNLRVCGEKPEQSRHLCFCAPLILKKRSTK